MHAPVELADITADVLARIKSRAPRVHCITNTVAQDYTANMLLAAGAMPSMTISPEEIAAFVAGADALLVNLGTFDAERRAAIEVALGAAGQRGCLGCSTRSLSNARRRARNSRAIWWRASRRWCGSTSANSPRLPAAIRQAKRRRTLRDAHRTIVALTGTTDVVTDGERSATVA